MVQVTKFLIFVRSDWKTTARSVSVDLVEAEDVNSEVDALTKEPSPPATNEGFCVIDEFIVHRRGISCMKRRSGYSLEGSGCV